MQGVLRKVSQVALARRYIARQRLVLDLLPLLKPQLGHQRVRELLDGELLSQRHDRRPIRRDGVCRWVRRVGTLAGRCGGTRRCRVLRLGVQPQQLHLVRVPTRLGLNNLPPQLLKDVGTCTGRLVQSLGHLILSVARKPVDGNCLPVGQGEIENDASLVVRHQMVERALLIEHDVIRARHDLFDRSVVFGSGGG